MNYFGNFSNNEHGVMPAEGYDINHGAEYQIAMESMQASLEISNAFARMASIDYTLSHDIEMVVATESFFPEHMADGYVATMEGMAGDVFSKVKDFIKKLWAKIKAFFASLVRSMDLMFKSTNDFVKKYKTQLTKLNLSGFKYVTYNYTINVGSITGLYAILDTLNDDVSTDVFISTGIRQNVGTDLRKSEHEGNEEAFKELDDELDRYRDKREERIDEFRAKIVGGQPTANTFRSDLARILRDNANSKTERHIIMNDIIRDIESSNKLRELVNKTQRDSDKYFSKKIDQIDKIEKAVKEKGAGATYKKGAQNVAYITKGGTKAYAERAAKYLNILSGDISARQAVINTAITTWNEAIKERDSEYKKIIRAALAYKAG